MATLLELLGGMPCQWIAGDKNKDTVVKNITCDSRSIEPGDIFVAVSGTALDGHEYIKDAIERGAAAVIVEKAVSFTTSVAIIKVPNSRKIFGELCAIIMKHPARSLKCIAVTGTNGKSSTAFMLKDLLGANNSPAGLIGTISYILPAGYIKATHTTPPAMDIQMMLSDMLNAGWEYAVMETSSHALDQDRLSGCEFELGIFTNLTQDHLDYHRNMEEYRAAKLKLLELLNGHNRVVYNGDDDYFKQSFTSIKNINPISYGVSGSNDIFALNIITGFDQTEFDIYENKKKISHISIPFSGNANVYNFLAAASSLRVLGFSWEDIISHSASLKTVPGRFEKIEAGDFHIYVDYAHTPDALKRLLQWANNIRERRIIVVFGCGGDRDKLKRPLMGRIVSSMSDFSFVTSDNPRTEEPGLIIRDIISGMPDNNKYKIITDRKEAIESALNCLKKDDILLVAGKGHEDYQILGRKKIHFDDREIARQWLTNNK